MNECRKCGKPLGTPLLCEACGALGSPAAPPGPFESLGLAPAWEVPAGALRKRLLALTRRMHPDFFANAAPEERALAERNTAELNAAFEILSDEAARADWLIGHLGGPAEGELREMPRDFLMEVLEWNEALEAARSAGPGTPARAALERLGPELEARRAAVLASVGRSLDPLPERGSPRLAEARRALNAARYLARALDEMRELRLTQAAPR